MKKYYDIDINGNFLVDIDAIKQSIINILDVEYGEIPFNRRLGTDIEKYLFEPFSVITKLKIESEIKRQVSKNLGNIIKIKSLNTIIDKDKKLYKIDLIYKVEGFGILEYSTSLKPK
jgi:phage baseplate assembly protein W